MTNQTTTQQSGIINMGFVIIKRISKPVQVVKNGRRVSRTTTMAKVGRRGVIIAEFAGDKINGPIFKVKFDDNGEEMMVRGTEIQFTGYIK